MCNKSASFMLASLSIISENPHNMRRTEPKTEHHRNWNGIDLGLLAILNRMTKWILGRSTTRAECLCHRNRVSQREAGYHVNKHSWKGEDHHQNSTFLLNCITRCSVLESTEYHWENLSLRARDRLGQSAALPESRPSVGSLGATQLAKEESFMG